MLDGATIEDPFSILSLSIEHPLEVGGRSDGDRDMIIKISIGTKKVHRNALFILYTILFGE